MILKIQRFSEDQTWWLLDDIRKISVSKPLRFCREDFKDDGVDADICLLDSFVNADQKPVAEFPYVRLICRLSNGSEFSVVFDTLAYLCNDEGKTIEKLTVS